MLLPPTDRRHHEVAGVDLRDASSHGKDAGERGAVGATGDFLGAWGVQEKAQKFEATLGVRPKC